VKLVVLFFFRGLGSTTGYVCYPCCFSCMKMEDYETFCKKHLSRIQEEATKGENSSTSLDRNVSLIQFHGVPVLSPLVSRCLFPPRRVNCAVGFDVCTDCPEGAAPFELFWPLLTAL